MSSQPVTHTIALVNGALFLLRQILNTPGWAKTTSEIIVGGQLLAEIVPEPDISWLESPEEQARLSPEDRKAYLERDRNWAKEAAPEITCTERQRDVCKKALQWAAEQGHLNGVYAGKLLLAFGFSE